jgi:hypothetical protein
MKSIGAMSRADLAAFIQAHLRARGVEVVLSGGACVSIYSRGRYLSMDLDLIHTGLMAPKRRVLREAMSAMGFSEDGRYFKHPDTRLFVEFPKGPPAVGEEPVREIHERRTATGMLRIISPTDCVKDRLTWFYHDQDRQCLEQAVAVAQGNPIDLAEVERWSAVEGKREQFEQIRELLTSKAQRNKSKSRGKAHR